MSEERGTEIDYILANVPRIDRGAPNRLENYFPTRVLGGL